MPHPRTQHRDSGESHEFATLSALLTESMWSFSPCVNMTLCVQELPFVAWMKSKKHVMGTVMGTVKTLVCISFCFSYPLEFVSEPLAMRFLCICELWMP